MESLLKYRERKNTDSVKWDGMAAIYGSGDLLPVWVADMDFEAPGCVKKALREYIDFSVFGYYQVPESYYQAFAKWEKEYHNFNVKKEWLQYIPGVVPALYWLVQLFTKTQDNIIIMPPVYPPFFQAIKENKRQIVECPLINNDGHYSMNFDLFEKLILEKDVKMFILCSPHNPVGRVWTKKELKKVLDICKTHNVYVIADEIHQDLIIEPTEQIAAASVGDYNHILVTLTAATKTFNLAGCQNALAVIPDENLRSKFVKYVNRLRVDSGNASGYIAVQAAYENGRMWLEELLQEIRNNYRSLKEMLAEGLPEAVISPLEGTYLAWVDLSQYLAGRETAKVMEDECRLAVNYGEKFGGTDYQYHIRINLATGKDNIVETARRLIEVLE